MDTMPEYTDHIPVMLNEVLDALNPAPGKRYIDGTLGLGGHTEALLERTAPDGIVLGFDRDAAAIAKAQSRLARFGDRLITAHSTYAEMKYIAAMHHLSAFDG